jgi:hypothetical protein
MHQRSLLVIPTRALLAADHLHSRASLQNACPTPFATLSYFTALTIVTFSEDMNSKGAVKSNDKTS